MFLFLFVFFEVCPTSKIFLGILEFALVKLLNIFFADKGRILQSTIFNVSSSKRTRFSASAKPKKKIPNDLSPHQ